jgi:hypothetical protein
MAKSPSSKKKLNWSDQSSGDTWNLAASTNCYGTSESAASEPKPGRSPRARRAAAVNVGPAAQTDVGIVKATSEKANVTASPIIVLGISEASLERGNGRSTTRLSQSYTYFQLLQQRSRHYTANSGAENTRLHDERKTESNRRGCNRPRHRGVVGRVRVGANVRTIGRQGRRPYRL